jgi:F-type H+-transporting ATPase subunit alpha
MKSVSRTLRADMARYKEVQAFAQFGTSDLDAATRNLLNRGEKLTEILKQGQYAPMPLEEMVAALHAGSQIDDLPTVDVRRFERELLAFLREKHADVLEAIRRTRDLDGETKPLLDGAIAGFKKSFKTSVAAV